MLSCVYHPIDDMRVVDVEEEQKLLESGVWFDSPAKAMEYKLKVEKDVKAKKLSKSKEKSQ